ncbi:helix-hairpin-helix domain-containing protein [Halobacterium litoreum]|uniref:Helix-hairpin-helix domain-containing protein n=1 Tax=Halobacterium litoreum TaxID=2039234 RepID=A0ABD5NGW5_9EURY|nr:helix-hairpin-helix domain-containing protein [Halobacterium litoreum]UHH12662.1 helix-hairpin-helix domain-containing protein [Halobacterium litoreum]
MGLLSKLKSLLGVDSSDESAGSGVDVTVEREPDAGSERAVKESSAETDEPADEDADEDAAAAGTDAAASTESLVDEDHADDPSRAAEPAEAAVVEDEESAPAGEPDIEEAEPETDADDGESVSVVKGIGPAYADRLEDAGVETVADLAAADVDELAEAIDLSPKRVGRWVENAQNRD